MMARRYSVTASRNSETQYWRGLLQRYGVTASCVYVCMCVRAWVRMCAGACMHVRERRNAVTP